MTIATIPQVNYVMDGTGKPVFVQLPVHDWDKLVAEYHRLTTLLHFKSRLKNAFREVRQIQRGEKQATSLADFLNEL